MPVALALRLLGSAGLLGVLGNWLLRAEPWGLNVFAGTTALTILTAGLVPSERSGAGNARRLLLLPPFFAGAVALRDAGLLSFWNLLAVAGTLILPVLTTGSVRLVTGRFLDYLLGAITTGVRTALGPLQLIATDVSWDNVMDRAKRRRFTAVALGFGLAVPLLVIFGALLVSADAGFERLVRTVFDLDLQALLSHVLGIGFIGWVSSGYLVAVLVGVREPATPWVSGFRPALGSVELGIPLGGLALLFSVFVVMQAGYVFGGQDLIRETANLGYADYARRGFFELVAVAVLILPVLLGVDLVADEDISVQQIVRGGSAVLLLLVGLIMLSALHRMGLYLDAYGLTQDRAYATGALLWAAVAIAWFAVTVLKGKAERFLFGAVVSALAVLSLLNVINVDAMIVRSNVARVRAGAELDAEYLASLSADAVPALVQALPNMSDEAACIVLEALAPEGGVAENRDWRTWHISRMWAGQATAGLERIRVARCALRNGMSP